mmetsp:Transcript_29326/g.60989  ORF Transcript_29326/g.60989 Transcript_29326/m.60989 type:complete len:276 (+) Transcript_29326:111-938(+)
MSSSWNHGRRPMGDLARLMRFVIFATVTSFLIIADVAAFSTISKSTATIGNSLLNTQSSSARRRNKDVGGNSKTFLPTGTRSSTSLNVLLEVPEYFFTFTFPMLGILLSVSKGFARLRLEESAWEQRLEEAREKRLREDPTLTEIELRRKEASLEWSAYGKPRQQEEERTMREEDFGSSGKVVNVKEREYDSDLDNRNYRMNDDEIDQFEMEYGVEYDPYYDDPYAEDELPDDIKFRLDKKYGDRIYENGEIFYKDKSSGLFYRQGAKPRNLSFW